MPVQHNLAGCPLAAELRSPKDLEDAPHNVITCRYRPKSQYVGQRERSEAIAGTKPLDITVRQIRDQLPQIFELSNVVQSISVFIPEEFNATNNCSCETVSMPQRTGENNICRVEAP